MRSEIRHSIIVPHVCLQIKLNTQLGSIDQFSEYLSLYANVARRKDFSALKSVYKHKAANEFLHCLEAALLTTKAVE